MAENIQESITQEVKVTAEEDAVSTTEIISINDSKKSTWELLSQYRAAILWSAFMGLGAINWGMDVLLSNGVISVPSFQKDFGYMFQNAYIISASWQIAFNTASSIGGFFGAIGSGYLADRMGKRITLAVGCVVSIGAVFIQIFAGQPGTLLAGKLINGLSLGCFLTIPSSFAAEICPVEVRGLTTSGVQLFIGIGQLAANLILKGTGTLDSTLAYKIPFALQFIFPVLLLLGLPFCPESPWFLVRKRRTNYATEVLQKLGYAAPLQTLGKISKTITTEEQKANSTSYLDCFRGSDLRRTEIAMGIFSVAQLSGVVFVVGYSSYFFEQAGLSASTSFSMSVGVSVLGLVGVVCSWFLINRTGRRSATLVGMSILTVLLFLIAILDILPATRGGNTGPVYGQVACIIAFAFIYLSTIGPIGFALFAEISSSRLRSRTVGLGIVVQNLFGVLMNIVVPLLINPDAANLKGKIGFIFGGTALVSVVWVYFRIPETAHRSFEELDYLFERRVSARKFKDVVVG
ncbi:general substrate transporter [Mollisia scopiformis]|uniref:General substrate transporter n=1 Tax=Mollisia scopiformis TaxID=149040 RepID=A0A194X8D1_MOLSC|nr:general substrate transporter [Mollisia scopiformis]KUJ16433.1 general substrate transporter [Mollisia scopiformis]